jgi:membrane associated rhomboid family serine protease
MFPIRTDAPLRRTPWANWALIAANVVAFVLQMFFERQTDSLLLNPAVPTVWQFFTYQFLHGSFLHIFSNMLFLFVFGNNVNDKMGNVSYALFYLAGGVTAGVCHSLGSDAPVLGASGAVAAVTGAYLVLFPVTRVTVLVLFVIITFVEIPSFLFVVFFFLLDVFKQFSPGMFGGQQAVAHLAHIGGTVYGLLVCTVLLSVRLLPRDQFDAIALVQRWNRRRQYRDMVASGYNPFGYSPDPRRTERPDPFQEQIQEMRAQVSEAIAHDKLDEAAALYQQLLRLDERQVLSRQNQLDVANQLHALDRHADAARAYEAFLATYGKSDQSPRVQLMLGLLYARYLAKPEPAKFHLQQVLPKLHDSHEIEIAREELAKL